MNSVTLPGATSHVTPALAKFLARRSRAQLETLVEAGIAMLDDIDGDADLEDGDSDMCPAGDDGGTGMIWLNPGDGLVGDPQDAEDDRIGQSSRHRLCGPLSPRWRA